MSSLGRTPVANGRMSRPRKSVYGLGDMTVNTVLSSLSLIFALHFLVNIAGLRPLLAGLVPLVGALVDALTDPVMGRLSDLTHTRWGRRRPFFLLGAIPFGLSFALLWAVPPFESQAGLFAYYMVTYIMLSLSMTIVSVPYLALIPEMAIDYDERTSINIYRNVGSTVGTFVAITLRPIAENYFGGGSEGFAQAGLYFGFLVAIPWSVVFLVSFERHQFQERRPAMSTWEGLKVLLQHRNYIRLMTLYIYSRMAMELTAAVLILFFTHVLGRSQDFEIMMAIFLGFAVLSMPFWLWVSRSYDKHRAFQVGAFGWMCGAMVFLFIEPDWPRVLALLIAPLIGWCFGAADLMPWAMIGEVIDEDDLATGERREGIYNGFFTFIRKIAGKIVVAIAAGILDLAGLSSEGVRGTETLWTIRLLSSVAPASFLLSAIWVARKYPLTRESHAQIRAQLDARSARDS